MESTCVDVPLNNLQRFIQLHKKVTHPLKVKIERFRAIGSLDIGMDQALLFSFMMNTIPHKIPFIITSMRPIKKYEGLSIDTKKVMDTVFTE